MPFTLDLEGSITASALPSHEEVLEAAKELISKVDSWKPGKKAHGVQSYSTKASSGSGPSWHARISKHSPDEMTFEQLWSVSSDDHYIKEKEYIPAMKSVDKLTDTDLGGAWALHYVFPPPISPRVFVQLITSHLEVPSAVDGESPAKILRTGYSIQLPFMFPPESPADAATEEKIGKGVRGRYVSVERVQELEDGTIEWRMATCSTPGGSIPAWISERSIPGEIIKDVPAVINWLKTANPGASTRLGS